MTVSKLSKDRIVQKRLAAFLVMFTAPQSVVPTTTSRSRCDRYSTAKTLDIVLEILLDAGLGLEAARPLSQDSCNWLLPRVLRAPKNGSRFEITIGLRGGYDCRGVIGATVVRSEAMTFEALTMMLRSLAALEVVEQV